MVVLSTVPRTRTLAPFLTAFAEAPWIFVADVSSTVTSTPVAVDRVKPDADVVSMMPVAPPAAGPLTALPPVTRVSSSSASRIPRRRAAATAVSGGARGRTRS